jgi:alkylation response protein AidB-like acyl-CoA dehydrogenase
MNFDLSDDQAMLQTALGQLTAPHRAISTGAIGYHLPAPELDRQLAEAGFFEVAREPSLGAPGAVLLIETVAALPGCVEVAASALVAGLLLPDATLPRPILLAEAPASGPIRFLGETGTALVATADDVRVVDVDRCRVEPVATPFGYPYGRFAALDLTQWPIARGVDPAALRQWWRVALAAEIAAAAGAALTLTVEHVKTREQFGRPIGSFQAVQHRLAECAALVEGTRLLARRAAGSGLAADAALAASYAQEAAARVCYDTHQFHGAMGITLECGLHFFTYRLRALQGELGGHPAQARAAAGMLWGGANR